MPHGLWIVIHHQDTCRHSRSDTRLAGLPKGIGGVRWDGLVGDRYGEDEPDTPVRTFTFRPDPAAVGFDDPLANGQSQTVPGDVPFDHSAIDTRVFPEQIGQLVRQQSPPFSHHRNRDVHPVALSFHPDAR